MEKERAVIDADFFIKLTEHNSTGTIFLKLMSDLEVQPVMHSYVARVELGAVFAAQKLIEDNQIQVIDYSDYIVDKLEDTDYRDYFYTAYERMNRFDFPKNEDIFTYHAVDESLGEIRSIYMAKIMGCPIFMSDDRMARRLATNIFLPQQPIEAKSLFQALMEGKEKGSSITLKELNPIISNVFRERRELLEKLREAYY